MATEPNTGLTWQEANSLTTDALHNQVVDLLAVWLNCSVLAVGQAAPTGSEAEGDRYIVGTGTGAFATHDDELAILRGGTWQFHAPPHAGVPIIKNQDDGSDWECVGGVWSVKAGGGGGAVSSVNGATGAVDTFGTGLDVDATGFRGIPQNSQSVNYTCVAADAGKEVYHPSGAGSGDTFTIPANASVAYEIGTAITFTNMDSNALSIAITTDTMYLAGVGTTGSRSLAQYGTATAVKKTSTTWLISGVGLT